MAQMQPLSLAQVYLAQVGPVLELIHSCDYIHCILLLGGIAWDWINEKLYWTDSCTDVIEVYDIYSRHRRVLLHTGSTSNNKDIVVDPTTGWLYWTDYYSSAPKISRMSMDGTEKEIIHNTSLHTPYGLTIDYDTQTLYWTDYYLNKIEKSNVDGSNRSIVTTLLINNPYSIDYYNGSLYWTDLSHNRILTTVVESADVTLYVGNAINDMYGIKAISEERQPLGIYNYYIRFCFVITKIYSLISIVPNPCERKNSNCSHFCFLSSTAVGNYRCGCPDEMILVNENTCERKYIRQCQSLLL